MAKHWTLWAGVAVASLLVAGCATTIGVHDPEVLKGLKFDSEKRVDVRFCVYLDDDVTIARARELLDTWNREEAEKFNIYIDPVSFVTRERETIFYPTLKISTQTLPLPVHCDRALWFIGRNTIDYLYGVTSLVLPLPEIYGYVDDETLTRGYVVAHLGSVGQAVAAPPKAGTVHEIYHFLGCRQHGNMEKCYHQLKELKTTFFNLKSVGFYRAGGTQGFYPTYGELGKRILVNHHQVARTIGSHARHEDKVPAEITDIFLLSSTP